MADNPQTEVEKWLAVIATYDNDFKRWIGRTEKILKKYRDDTRSPSGDNQAKFNILWSNVQTLVPAVYARMPKADVSRRFGDNDPVGRVASLLLERALDYEIEHYTDFRSGMKHAVEDRFLGGRGVTWVRYDPHLKAQDIPKDGLEITDVVEGEGPQDQTAGMEEQPEEIDYECTPVDYVYWKDFGHSSGRTWEEVTQVWRWVFMSKEALTERFGEGIAKKVPIDTGPEPLVRQGMQKVTDKAKVCELWDKESGNVYWLCKGMEDFLDERPDPLNLEGFFPCPKPLYATTTSDSLIPVPDFVLYQDQANELDILSDRIDGLVKSLRVRGVYNSSIPALQRLLTEGDNNTLIPCEQWGAFAEKGGLKGSIDLLPLDTLAAALLQCYQAQANVKAQVYDITGISDIVRGASVASETATAQEIKGQYANLRLKAMQEAVALFASDIMRLMAQIICTKYQPKTILAYAAAQQLSQADQQLIPQALQLLKNKPLQNFRVGVAADSLVQLDEAENKQERVDFLNAMSTFLREAVPAGQQTPQIVPMLMEMIKYGVEGFKQARTIEGTIDQALEALKAQAAQAAANPQPHPDIAKAQAQAQSDAKLAQMQAQSQTQIAQIRAQSDQQLEVVRQQGEAQKMQFEAHMNQQQDFMEQQFNRWEALLKAKTSIDVAEIAAGATLDAAQASAAASASDSAGA